ncbi:hypothetical protein Tsubulata_028475 [Turnera subulata]|uniref:Agglutinin domain-containing protein n=1 Tax=Turnera subulata TaxID=218843 RepID=A0A9Q0FQH3_9ROSI|nr:hypothetical protein Tsubulata_028475 [Turnera subulata]
MALALHIKSPFSLKYNDKFLGLASVDNGNGEVHELLKPYAVEAKEEVTKFEFVASSGPDNSLVHIKYCHNKKFLRSLTKSLLWITPAEDKPEEDRSKWTCTLFKPILVGSNTLELIHVESKGHVLPCTSSAYDSCLFALQNPPDHLEPRTFTTVFEFGPPTERHIKVSGFRLDEYPRVLPVDNITVGQEHADNMDNVPKAMKVTILHDQLDSASNCKTWKFLDNNDLWSNSDVTTFLHSPVPVLSEAGKIEVSEHFRFHGPYKLGTRFETRPENMRTTLEVVVPPKTRVTATIKASKVSFDMPFSYSYTGNFDDPARNNFVDKLEDGMFTGVSLYDFIYQTQFSEIETTN